MMSNKNVLKFVREDDYVEYFIYPTKVTDENDNILENYLEQIKSIVKKYTETYLWHKDEFNLNVKSKSVRILDQCIVEQDEIDFRPHLHGITHFGDNIEDEWFIVYLLMQISKTINDVIIQVNDNDGEFLLIEAANFLPDWANPDTCENRVYIYQGKIRIIPKVSNKTLTLEDALSNIVENPSSTEAAPEIQQCIQKRLENFNNLSSNLHRATIYLPIAVAAILKAKPQLVAPAVLAFCNRDSIDLKACRAMRFFPPENRVHTSVLFTKHLYAMLNHSNYVPDRRTGWNLPSQNDSVQFKAHNLGVRLACGFEILVSQAKSSATDGEDIETDRSWQIFLGSLKKNNYFRDLLEHSKDYNNLLNEAKDYYKKIRDLERTVPSIGKEILDLNRTLDYNIEEFKELEKSLPPDDDESWLNVNPDELDQLLQSRFGSGFNNGESTGNITKKLNEFMNHISDVDGAEFPQDKLEESSPPVRPKRGIKKAAATKSNESPAKIDERKINFDPNEFTNAIQNILEMAIPDDSWDLESGSEMSEYENESEGNMEFEERMSREADNNLKRYMDAMDRELAETTIGQSFEKKSTTTLNKDDSFDDIENFQPIDIDRNALKNILKSYKSQFGEAGPAENLLGPMGVKFDDLNIDDD